VVSLWRGADLKRVKRLDDYVSARLTEIEHVLVHPSTTPGYARLHLQQKDGELFEASQLSDGVMYVLGLAVHMISADAGQILFIEEPETGVHPRRLGEVVDLLRTIADEGRQIIVSTHSPTMLDAFKDQPEAIVLFRRGASGTVVRTLASTFLERVRTGGAPRGARHRQRRRLDPAARARGHARSCRPDEESQRRVQRLPDGVERHPRVERAGRSARARRAYPNDRDLASGRAGRRV